MVSGQWRKHAGSVLKSWREGAGMTQAELGIELGYDRQTISKYESGAADWTGYTAFQWATACGLNPYAVLQDLFGPEKHTTARDRVVAFMLRGASDSVADAFDFYVNGNHGSDLEAFVQKGVADLQSTLQGRVASTALIVSNYEYAAETDQLSDGNGPKPDMEKLSRAKHEGHRAAVSGQKGYRLKEGETE